MIEKRAVRKRFSSSNFKIWWSKTACVAAQRVALRILPNCVKKLMHATCWHEDVKRSAPSASLQHLLRSKSAAPGQAATLTNAPSRPNTRNPGATMRAAVEHVCEAVFPVCHAQWSTQNQMNSFRNDNCQGGCLNQKFDNNSKLQCLKC
jgi:hypothetical protein